MNAILNSALSSQTQPQGSVLARKCVMVSFSRRGKTFTHVNKRLSREVEAERGMNEAGSWTDKYVAPRFLKPVNTVLTAAYNAFNERTLPYALRSTGILPIAAKAEFYAALNPYWDQLREVTDYLQSIWDTEVIPDAKSRLNGNYDSSKMPTADQVIDLFGFSVHEWPVPDSSSILAELEQEQREELEQELSERMAEIQSNAVYEIWSRLYRQVLKLRDSLERYDNGDGTRKRYSDSWIENLRDFASVIPALNFTDDPHLEEMRQKVESELLHVSSEGLKESETLRKAVAASSNDVLSALAGLVG